METAPDDEPSSLVGTALLAPALYVVATPIGNLEDISLRALRVLQQADLIACEDTRHTQKLLNHFNIKTPTQSYHEHNEAARTKEFVERIHNGERIALVSDAGMPGISDPGERVIRAAVERGLNVVPIPGPSALVSALVASGLPAETFWFAGFLPSRSGERRSMLEAQRQVRHTIVFYETPHRIMDTLADLQNIFGPERRIVVARELTKIHEEFLRGTVVEVSAALRSRGSVKGEMTLIIAGAQGDARRVPDRDLGRRMSELMVSDGQDEKAALKQVAKEFGLSRSEAYREWQRRRDKR